MAIPENLRTRVEAKLSEFCGRRSPPEFRDQMRLEFSVEGNAVTIVDRRPPWPAETDDEWSSLDVAQLRFHPTTRMWSLWWQDSDGRWHRFERAEAIDVDDLLKIVDEDPTAIFWG